jgi:hypothetical protein
MLLVFGWRAVYGTTLSFFTTIQNEIVGKSEEEAIGIIKQFVKEGNIDLETFFNRIQQFSVPKKELKKLGDRISESKLSDDILFELSSNCIDFDIFATYDKHVQPVDLTSKIINTEQISHENINSIFYHSPSTKRESKRIPKKFNQKQKTRISSVIHHNPLDMEKHPKPVQVTSEDDSELL